MSWIRFSLVIGMALVLLFVLAGCELAQRSERAVRVQGRQTPGPSTSTTWRDPITGMEFVKVPGGSFKMGCHANAGECRSNERPARTVQMDGFWMGKYEVTQGQWIRIMGNNPSAYQTGGNYPVETVSWIDVQEFIRRLNRLSSAKFRLPSEAQWEFACRAGGKSITFGTWNGSWSHLTGNSGGTLDGHEYTAPVGSFPPNALGMYDMSGNVWEWVQDIYTKNYGNVGINNPIFTGPGADRVIRGSGWDFTSRGLRCSSRNSSNPSSRGGWKGFRLVRK